MTVNPIAQNKNIENYRSKLSKTDVQKKRFDNVREAVVVNGFVKDTIGTPINIEDNFIIPQHSKINSKFEDNRNNTQKVFSNIFSHPIFPLCATALGVLGGVALSAKLLHSTAKINLKASKLDRLPDLPRNMNLNTESDFVTYMAVQNPNTKTILGAMGAISFASAVFVIKNFIDGFKDIWVKKQEAGIQKNLQEALINVETRSFSEKNKVIRNLMREKANEMGEIIHNSQKPKPYIPPIFEGFMSFKGNTNTQNTIEANKSNNLIYAGIGILTIGLSAFFAKKTIGSLRAIGKELNKYNSQMHNNMDRILTNTTPEKLKANKANLLDIFSVLNFKPQYVREKLQKAGMEASEINNFIANLEKRYQVFVNAPEALGGRQGIQYYSYINDVQGHLYNWIMNANNGAIGNFTKNLFFALTTVSGLGYLGKTAIEGVREVQVKKINAQTDLELNKKLVDIEIRNFEAKKRSIIEPLMTEFVKTNRRNQNKDKTQSMVNEILNEIKNGAPYVYS